TACLFASLLSVASCAFANSAVAAVVASPAPAMGSPTTTLLWQGAPELPGHPRVWRFAFGPTRIPGAPTVRIYVTPLGHLVETQPADLEARVKTLHPLP